MIHRSGNFWVVLAVLALGHFRTSSTLAQDQPPVKLCSIGGTVRNATSGQPLSDINVSLESAAGHQNMRTNASGEFGFKEQRPGRYVLRVLRGQVNAFRAITLQPEEEVTGEDFRIVDPAVLAGRVADSSGRPVPGVTVSVARLVYFNGALIHAKPRPAITDDMGEYRLPGLMPGIPYMLSAEPPTGSVVVSASTKKTASKETWSRSYFPDSPVAAGMMPVTLGVGEIRERIDFRLVKRQSFCVDGWVSGGTGGSTVSIETADALPGWSTRLGRGATDPGGKFTACGLPPGSYRAVAVGDSDANQPPRFGVSAFEISEKRLARVTVTLRGSQRVKGQVTWAGKATEPSATWKLRAIVMPEGRSRYVLESFEAIADTRGEFVLPNLLVDRYRIRLYDLPVGVYAKDITFGGSNLLRESMSVGGTLGDEIVRVTLANDGGSVRVSVVDDKDKPLQDALVVVFPRDSVTESDLAQFFRPFGTDRDGATLIPTLAPGRYYALAVSSPFEPDPEALRRILALRSKAKEIELLAHGALNLRLEAVNLQ